MEIFSNGSKWYGEGPDQIEKLLERLQTHALDPMWENLDPIRWKGLEAFYGPDDAPAFKHLGLFRAHGNFYDYSHVFNIQGTEEELKPIREAIEANLQSEMYQKAKAEYVEDCVKRKAIWDEHRQKLDQKARERRTQELRAELAKLESETA